MAAEANGTATAGFSVDIHWPLYTVLPAVALYFYFSYYVLWPFLLPRSRFRQKYAKWSRIQQMCFRANLGSAVHSYGIVLLLVIVLASDETILTTRVHRHYNPIGYSAMCFTLGYFSLSVPWSANLLFIEKRKDAVPPAMMLHHVLVVCGALVYVLGGLCAFYGTIAFVCMELTNLFFIPRILSEILGYQLDGPLCTVNGIMLVLTFVLFRVGVCTGVLVLFTVDLVAFESVHAVEWALVIICYVVFVSVVVLSWIWMRRVLRECGDGVKALLKQRRAHRAQHAMLKAAATSPKAPKTALGAPKQPPQPKQKEAENAAARAPVGERLDPDPPYDAVAPAAIDAYCPSRGDDQAGAWPAAAAHAEHYHGVAAASSPSKGSGLQRSVCAPPKSMADRSRATLDPLSELPMGRSVRVHPT